MNTLTCERVMILLPLYLEDKTTEIESLEIEKHLMECPECMAKYSDLQSVANKIKLAFDNIEHQNFEKEKNYFNENLCAYLDNELSFDDYYVMSRIVVNNDYAKKDAEEMYNFDENFRKSIEENKLLLQQDFSSNVVKQIKKNSSDYVYKLYVKAAVITVIFISITLLIGYFSAQNYFDNFSFSNINFAFLTN